MHAWKRSTRRKLLRARRFVVHNLLHADDPPHRLALGVAIGIFVTFTPFIGIQMVLVVILAWLLRANKAVGVPVVWISNPATFVPIYYPCYLIGRAALGWPAVGRQWWDQLTHPPAGFWAVTEFYWSRVFEIFAPLTLGCLLVGTPLATTTYLITRRLICGYRQRRGWMHAPPPTATLGNPSEKGQAGKIG
jgi:hypothetical protein